MRRLTFNTPIGNADIHRKNWSLIDPDRRHASLSPACDFVSIVPNLPDRNAALNVSRTKRLADFTEDELSHMAANARMPEKLVLDTARVTVGRLREVWRNKKGNLPITDKTADAIEVQLEIVPNASES